MEQRPLGVSAPEGMDVHELLLRVRSRPSILGKISNIMGERNVDILAIHGQVADDKKTADLLLYVEMGGSTVGIMELLGALKEKDFVIEAQSLPRNQEYFEGFKFPLTSGGHYRVFAVGAAGWAAVVSSLLKTFGSGGQTLLVEEGRALGGEMVERIGNDARFGKKAPSRGTLLANFKGLFRASGLGRLDLTEAGAKVIEVSIVDSAASSSKEGLLDHFLVGVVRGAVEKAYGAVCTIEELKLTKSGAIEFKLRFAE